MIIHIFSKVSIIHEISWIIKNVEFTNAGLIVMNRMSFIVGNVYTSSANVTEDGNIFLEMLRKVKIRFSSARY